MKILWFINIAIPQISEQIGAKNFPIGGWMVRLADTISSLQGIRLFIAFPYCQNVKGTVNKICYYGFKCKENSKGKNIFIDSDKMEQIIVTCDPNVIHVFGTEFPHSYEVAHIAKKLGIIDKVVISIQGMAGVISKHYYAFLEYRVVFGWTLRDLLKGNIRDQKKQFIERGKYETQALREVHNIIGRTDWDKSCTFWINNNAKYFHNSEMLRDSFYNAKSWDVRKCERYSIFLSQGAMPLKGLHLVLEALCILKEYFPKLKLYIAGKNFYQKSRWRLSYYERYILNYIRDNELRCHVIFTGFLDESHMVKRYLESNVFVSASSVENSSNSICEAMILGVPVVSSFVGGCINLIDHGTNGFYYQADAPYMLAYYVKKIFESDTLAKKISDSAVLTAKERHNPEKVTMELLSIYSYIDGESL